MLTSQENGTNQGDYWQFVVAFAGFVSTIRWKIGWRDARVPKRPQKSASKKHQCQLMMERRRKRQSQSTKTEIEFDSDLLEDMPPANSDPLCDGRQHTIVTNKDE